MVVIRIDFAFVARFVRGAKRIRPPGTGRSRNGMPFAASAFFIDEKAARPAIDARLEELETLARQTGRAVALGYPYPVTLERVAAWARGVEKRGFVLAPVSALAARAEPE